MDEHTNDIITLTHEMIPAARTPNGGYTKKQLAAIGVDWPPQKGWSKEVVGKQITRQQFEIFSRTII